MNLEQEYESKNQLVAQQKPICFAAPNAEWQPLAGSDRSELAESFFLSILTQTDQISLGPLQARQAHKYRLATPVLCVVCTAWCAPNLALDLSPVIRVRQHVSHDVHQAHTPTDRPRPRPSGLGRGN